MSITREELGEPGSACPSVDGDNQTQSSAGNADAAEVKFDGAKTYQRKLWDEASRLGRILDAFPKSGPIGLTPDVIKFSPEYRKAKADYTRAFRRLAHFNSVFCRAFKFEIAAERRVSMLKRMSGARALSKAEGGT